MMGIFKASFKEQDYSTLMDPFAKKINQIFTKRQQKIAIAKELERRKQMITDKYNDEPSKLNEPKKTTPPINEVDVDSQNGGEE